MASGGYCKWSMYNVIKENKHMDSVEVDKANSKDPHEIKTQ